MMKKWNLHWLHASGDLEGHRDDIFKNFEAAYAAIESLLPPPHLDILIERLAGQTIPELGLVGHAYRSTLLSMTLDPDNPNFAASLADGTLQRMIAHEVHHCMRMSGPGYGETLGEALVSEGLAGRFVQRVFRSDPEPWEAAVSLEELQAMAISRSLLPLTDYDHSAWFYGTGSLPIWLGYSLGFEIAGCWLHEKEEVRPSDLIDVPASAVIDAAVRHGLLVR